MKKLFLIFLTVFVVSAATLGLYLSKDGLNFDSWEKNIKTENKYAKEFEVDESQFGNIVINLERGFINIKKGEKFGFYLKSQKNLDEEMFEIRDGSLYYKGVISEVEVIVILPENKEFDIDLDMNIGDIEVGDINNAKVKLSIGNIDMINIKNIDKLELGTGNATLEKIGSIGEVVLNIGDLEVEILNQNKEFRVINKIGDIELYINEDFDGKLSTDLGLGELDLKGISGGDKYLGYIKSTIGDVNIEGVNNGK